MGGRHCTFLRLVGHTFVTWGAMFFLILLAFPNQLVPPRGQPDYRATFAVNGFLLGMWIFGLANLLEIRQRKKAGIQWHSHYGGLPRFLPDNALVRCLIIPLGGGGIAYGLYRLSQPLGIYLFIMAAMQLVDAVDSYRTKRSEKLDRSDREISMEIKTAELENRNRGPLEIVRVAKPSSRMRLPQEIEQFEARWKKVLKSSDDSQN